MTTAQRFVPELSRTYQCQCPQDNATGRALHPPRGAARDHHGGPTPARADEGARAQRAPRAQGRIQDDGGDGHGRDLSGEMEDVFLRGIRTLLARYMERRLQPALRDAVLSGMGYSVSYGR